VLSTQNTEPTKKQNKTTNTWKEQLPTILVIARKEEDLTGLKGLAQPVDIYPAREQHKSLGLTGWDKCVLDHGAALLLDRFQCGENKFRYCYPRTPCGERHSEAVECARQMRFHDIVRKACAKILSCFLLWIMVVARKAFRGHLIGVLPVWTLPWQKCASSHCRIGRYPSSIQSAQSR